MRWPLRYQILFPFAAAMLAVVVSVSLLDAYLAARRTQQRIESQLRSVAETLLEANFPLTDSVLRQTRGLSGAEFVLTDSNGVPQATTLPNVQVPSIGPTVVQAGLPLGAPLEWSGQTFFHTAVTIRARSGESREMVLHILYPERFLREARWQAAYPPLLVGGVLLCVVVVLAMVIAARLSRPILELRRQLSRLVQGDFEPVPLPQRNDELRDLIGSVNVLADQLEELRCVIKRTERLSLLGQLSGGLAHQLRNSVTGARLAVQLHGRHCQEVDPDSLTVALRQLAITEAHLQRFLSAGQPNAPRHGRCELTEIVGDAASLIAPACQHRDVKLEVFGDPAPSPIELYADADQLRQLILNLLLNAVESAGRQGWVCVELNADDRACHIRVRDSGPGPEPAIVERLFEPFATGKPEGVGLGLTVAKTIAESHGGTIRFVGSGPTCFAVTLPRLLAGNSPSADGLVDLAANRSFAR